MAPSRSAAWHQARSRRCRQRCCGNSWARRGRGDPAVALLAIPAPPAKQQPGESMPEKLVQPPRHPYQTFLDFPLATELDKLDAHIAILGLPYGAPYRMSEVTNDQSNAPTAVRVASARLSQALDRHDFDFGGTLFAGKAIKVVDCGDVVADPWDMRAHYRKAEAAARKILARAGMLISIGGDHGV